MKYLHTMVRVSDVDKSLDFYCNRLGLKEVRRMENEAGRYTLIFLAAPGDEDAQIELTYNWDPEAYGEGRNFGHLAYQVEQLEQAHRIGGASADVEGLAALGGHVVLSQEESINQVIHTQNVPHLPTIPVQGDRPAL